MTTPPVWSSDGSDVTMVDLDLDVFQRHDGSVIVDDEDEFAAHQVELAYPAGIPPASRNHMLPARSDTSNV